MRCHWESQTRKLNKHYQSAGRIVAPQWGAMRIVNCGGCISQLGFDYGLTLDKNGIWVWNNASNTKGTIEMGRTSIINLQGNILPLFYIMYEDITINGQPFPDLRNVQFSDSTGKLHAKYDTVTLTTTWGSHTYTETANVILVYINVSDLVMYSQYVTDYMLFTNVKWNYSFNQPTTNPFTFGVQRDVVGVYDSTFNYLTNAHLNYTKTLQLNSNFDYEEYPPSIGSGVVFDTQATDPYEFYDPFFGFYGVLVEFRSSVHGDYTHAFGLTNAYGTDYDETYSLTAVYDNFGVGNSFAWSSNFHYVTISDNDGLFFDFMNVSDARINTRNATGTFNGTHIIGWQ